MSTSDDSASETVPTGFDAMGEPVPDRRKAEALRHLRAMHPNLSTEREMEVVGKVAAAIEHDEPYDAIEAAREELDLTGAYRLLAVVCAAEVSR